MTVPVTETPGRGPDHRPPAAAARRAAGGGASLKLGQHLVLPKDTPLCNVWLTMLHGLGLDPKKHERHGDSTGVVKELVG